jgi:hypothetical protein
MSGGKKKGSHAGFLLRIILNPISALEYKQLVKIIGTQYLH